MDRVRYWMALTVLMLMPGVLIYWLSIHPFVRFWRGLGVRSTMAVHLVVMAAVASVVYLLRDGLLEVDYGTSQLRGALAVLLLLLASRLRQALGKQLKFRTLTGVAELAGEPGGQRLLTAGIYARLRHPRYVELWLLLLAAALFANYRATYITVALAVPAILAIVHVEERELRDRFGDQYVRYCARVPRFWPW